MLVWKYLICPFWSADTSQEPAWLHSIARTAESCACRIVSKLNVSPFQSVNSPLVEPVSSRRPSGSQRTTFTGHRILFVDVCTSTLATDDTDSAYASGGSSSTTWCALGRRKRSRRALARFVRSRAHLGSVPQ